MRRIGIFGWMLATAVACGEPTGSLGGECYGNATCDDGLVCNRDGECEKAEPPPPPVDPITLEVTAPDLVTAVGLGACAERAALGAELAASMAIGGHPECQLSVDNSTLVASGDCAEITVGIIRPLGITYSVPEPEGSNRVAVAYAIARVDLQNISEPAPVAVDFAAATFVSSNEDVAALPDDTDCDGLTGSDQQACKAQAWAKGRLVEQLVDFDIDTDTETNLFEACAGTLFL